jgi:hypothetical protein
MARNRFVLMGLPVFILSATAVMAGDPPTPPPAQEPVTVHLPSLPSEPPTQEPVPVVQASEPPPPRIIKIEIGFEPWPPEEAPASIPEAPVAPVAYAPGSAAVPPPAPEAMTAKPEPTMPKPEPALPRTPPLTLVALERMALSRGAKSQPARGDENQRPEETGIPAHEFVDEIVLMSAVPSQPQAVTTPEQARDRARHCRLLNAVRMHYYYLLALQRLIAVREELCGTTRDAVVAIDGMIAAGRATKAELLQARIEAREQAAGLQTAKAVHDASWKRMAAMIGRPDLAVAPLAGDLEQCCSTPAQDAAWAHVRESNPDLLAARCEVNRRQAALRQNLATESGNAAEESRSFITAFFTSKPAPRPAVKQAAWTELARCEADLGKAEQSLRQRLADAYARYDRAKDLTETYRSQNLPEAKEAYELSVVDYRQGRGSWPQVQLAQRSYFRMSTEYVDALAELRRCELVILGLGMDAPESTTASK